jgi:hypothetical protein
MDGLDGDTFPAEVINKPLCEPQVAPLNFRGIPLVL